MDGNRFVKITNAVYEILDFLPESDPLKNKAKEKALAILEGLTAIFSEKGWASVKNYLSSEMEKTREQTIKDIEVLENYLRVAKRQKWVSDMNFLIIANGYNEIKNQIRENKIFVGGAEKIISGNVDKLNVPPGGGDFSGEILNMGNKENLPKREQNHRSATSLNRNQSNHEVSARQEKIIKILFGRENVQVADIIEALSESQDGNKSSAKLKPGVTKRTIRRDLDDLLKRGKVVRLGQWNRVSYKLAIGHG